MEREALDDDLAVRVASDAFLAALWAFYPEFESVVEDEAP
jgi:hypothetical protein